MMKYIFYTIIDNYTCRTLCIRAGARPNGLNLNNMSGYKVRVTFIAQKCILLMSRPYHLNESKAAGIANKIEKEGVVSELI